MPNYLSDYVLTVQTSSPSSFHEAMQSVDAADWRKAMEEELHSLEENSGRWVLRIKTKADGSAARCKARLVAKGYMQRPAMTMMRPSARWLVLILALKEEVYVKQPEGFENGTNQVYKLNRSLYDLKEAPRCWNLRLVAFLKHSTADPCLFARMKERSKLICGDLLMKKEFQIKQGPLDTFLGMGIKVLSDGSIFAGQQAYTRHILIRFHLDEANSLSTPAEISVPMEENKEHLSSDIPYREAVGALMYHKYLRGTADYGLLYQAKGEGFLKGYSDADYAGDVTTRRSHTGVVCICAGGAVLWHSQKQKSVALSTTEAEYVAASEAAKDMMWLMTLFAEVTEVKQKPILFVDNTGAVKFSNNPEFYKRSKHIDVRFHFVREKYERAKSTSSTSIVKTRRPTY
ncbi:Retrovirus-related Pol polyprotein from transposon TNT 1-94 [Trichinella pseudospiralis]|uniref:Retrovirus-related Pol polyprotein from transposon TNT 1-94 n=1 Tax=Trichinella pseudospiralis TaxID=6337 RepID=A0A0V1IP03_TRIPS|nr:Retrovirus-related Pol polyprotein from transposon TNT 1-94 [Trichinella pseudospiralis]